MTRLSPNWRIATLAAAILVFDQITELIVLRYLNFAEEKVVIEGFFKFVHWGNTGAAWSMFMATITSSRPWRVAALVVLFFARHHFDLHTVGGQVCSD